MNTLQYPKELRLNPLKSGPAFGLKLKILRKRLLGGSQSPQIGACFRTEQSTLPRNPETDISIPSNRGLLSDREGRMTPPIHILNLNPLKSGPAFGLSICHLNVPIATISIPSNRGLLSDHEEKEGCVPVCLSQSPQIGACFRTQKQRTSH